MTASGPAAPGAYGWIIFALILGLMLSDYMSRNVLSAVFPLLKSEWALSDEKLGRLGSVIPLMVGLLSVPLSLLADRLGRVRAIIVMALVWSLATLLCGLARTYGEMLAARALIGLGEAAYGSVGLAVILGVFPARMRAVLTAAFMAGGPLGSVIGVALGGTIAAHYGWRAPFAFMAAWGVILTAGFALIAREARLAPPQRGAGGSLRSVIASPALRLVYLGSGLQLFVTGALIAWLPTWFARIYHLPLGMAGQASAALMLVQALGMVVCGHLSDRLAMRGGERRYQLAVMFGLSSAALLVAGFVLPPGPLQLALIAAGAFVAAGTTGPVGSLVAQLTQPALLATALAAVTLTNNIVGLAPGSWAAGQLADRLDIGAALALCSLTPILAAACFRRARQLTRSASCQAPVHGHRR